MALESIAANYASCLGANQMWTNAVSSNELRLQLPEEAFAMESLDVHFHLSSLGLKFKPHKRKKSISFIVQLVGGYEMSITPVDVGFGGFSEFYTWQHYRDSEESEGELVNSIRASVAFTSPESHCGHQTVIFTIHAKDIESLIRGSLRTYFELTGKKLNPIVKTNKSN